MTDDDWGQRGGLFCQAVRVDSKGGVHSNYQCITTNKSVIKEHISRLQIFKMVGFPHEGELGLKCIKWGSLSMTNRLTFVDTRRSADTSIARRDTT